MSWTWEAADQNLERFDALRRHWKKQKVNFFGYLSRLDLILRLIFADRDPNCGTVDAFAAGSACSIQILIDLVSPMEHKMNREALFGF